MSDEAAERCEAVDTDEAAAGDRGRLRLPAAAGLVVLALAAGTVLWLALTASDTMERLRQARAAASPPVIVLLAPPGGAATGAVETGAAGRAGQAAGDGALRPASGDTTVPLAGAARPFAAAPGRPRIAIIVQDLALSDTATRTAIDRLPAEVTLAFSPYGRSPGSWVDAARADGHETLMMVPMEPAEYPRLDPGPHTLRIALPPTANVERLDWVLGRADGLAGVLTHMGARFTASPEALRPVMTELAGRGLLFVAGREADAAVAPALATELGVPFAAAAVAVDADLTADAIDLRLFELESVARDRGAAVGVAGNYPLVLDRLAAWLPTLDDRGLAAAPVTAVAAGGSGMAAGQEEAAAAAEGQGRP